MQGQSNIVKNMKQNIADAYGPYTVIYATLNRKVWYDNCNVGSIEFNQ